MEAKCIRCRVLEAVNETYDALNDGWIEPELASAFDYLIDKLIDKGVIRTDDV